MISVIIPTADRPGPLHRALRSLSRQYLRDFEVIVVDDGHRSAVPVVDGWRHDLTVTLIDGGQRGVSHARNTGLAAARGEYVAFLDDDDVYFPRHLATAHQALREGRADLVYGGALVSPRWIEAVPRDTSGLPRKDYTFDARFLLVANFIHTGSVVTHNFTATPVRFDETLAHCEDWDLWLALQSLGYRFAPLSDLTCAYHQVPRATGTVAAAYRESPTPFTRARARLYATWPSPDTFVDGYRAWFRAFDGRLDTRISCGRPVPDHVYEHAVRRLYRPFSSGQDADLTLLDELLPELPVPVPAPLGEKRREVFHAGR